MDSPLRTTEKAILRKKIENLKKQIATLQSSLIDLEERLKEEPKPIASKILNRNQLCQRE